MSVPLSLRTLDDLPADVGRPVYARGDLSPGIVHFGVGNFHRAHMAWYLDRLMNAGRDLDWAILGAGVMTGDARMREALAPQDWLSTVVTQSAARSEARVTGPMTGFLPVGDGEAIHAALTDPRVRIVSLTVTEGGYFVDAATGRFDATSPLVAADADMPETPRTVFGHMLRALAARRAAGVPPFTVLSCDNVPHNGAVTQAALAGLAELHDPELASWVRAEVACPNGMVDRIAPATGDRERRILRDEFGVEDAWPVFCEDFVQWVLEDRFPAGRPAFERVGVTFVEDVTPFETMKIRILNGGHATIAYPAGLLDIEFVHDAMDHPLVGAFLDRVEREEILPVVPPVPGTDLEAYLAKIRERFSNPKIGDTVRRLCLDGSNRQPKFIVPSVADRLAQGGGVEGLALTSAFWCRYCAGTTDSGREIAPNDPAWEALTARAAAARADPLAWLAMREVYGDVGDATPFREAFARHLSALWRDGTEAVLRRYLGTPMQTRPT
jgi:mannitol 2-dehydrogenase